MTARIRTFGMIGLLLAALSSIACQAVDSPDAPDYLSNFQKEAAQYVQMIPEEATTTAEMADGYRDYIEFLEQELITAEAAVESELGETDRMTFAEAKAAWRTYRDAEKELIASVWVPGNFGSSSAVSRLAFYAELLRARIELLQKYRLQF